jgi:hypothetical protein
MEYNSWRLHTGQKDARAQTHTDRRTPCIWSSAWRAACAHHRHSGQAHVPTIAPFPHHHYLWTSQRRKTHTHTHTHIHTLNTYRCVRGWKGGREGGRSHRRHRPWQDPPIGCPLQILKEALEETAIWGLRKQQRNCKLDQQVLSSQFLRRKATGSGFFDFFLIGFLGAKGSEEQNNFIAPTLMHTVGLTLTLSTFLKRVFKGLLWQQWVKK